MAQVKQHLSDYLFARRGATPVKRFANSIGVSPTAYRGWEERGAIPMPPAIDALAIGLGVNRLRLRCMAAAQMPPRQRLRRLCYLAGMSLTDMARAVHRDEETVRQADRGNARATAEAIARVLRQRGLGRRVSRWLNSLPQGRPTSGSALDVGNGIDFLDLLREAAL